MAANRSGCSRRQAATGATNGGSRSSGEWSAFEDGDQAGGVDRAVDDEQIVLRQAQVFQKLGADFQRAAVFDLQPHGVAAAAVVQFVFHRLEQVGRFLLVNVKLAVAGDAEMPVAEDFRAGKQVGQIMADQIAQKQIMLLAPGRGAAA